MHLIVAKPRGFCAGVQRAIRVVELALERYGPPVYVRREIVHNRQVVQQLRQRGAIFVDELDQISPGSVAILSAHGSPPEVYAQAHRLRLRLIDATCPLVTKVHREVHRYAARGYCIVLIGHAGHDEIVGTMGQAPQQTVLVENVADARRIDLPSDQKGIILTQTTLSQDDARQIIEVLRRRYPHLELPPSDDICYATQNRQNAVRNLCSRIDLLLVVGSVTSSNSRRLVEVARAGGVEAQLIDGPEDLRPDWLRGRQCIGITSGASAPEEIVQAVISRLHELGAASTEEMDAPDEHVTFALPPLPSCAGDAGTA